jgi:hypothetical protein
MSTSNPVTGVIELNDYQLKLSVGDQSWTSSGFATLISDGVLFGEQSRQQSRLQPLVSFNQYWNQLSLESIANGNNTIRHYADLAYHQLLQLHQQAEHCAQVILAVPTSFDREQLSLLLGICGQCPFKVIGVVDSAITAVADKVDPGHYLYLDLQLHQCLLTEIVVDQHIHIKSTDIINGTGLVNLYQYWAKFLAAQFIQQCRFDPLHDAATEQQLYDILPQLLNASQDEIQLTVQGNQVKLNRQSLARHTQGLFVPVFKAINHLGHNDCLLVSERITTVVEILGQLNSCVKVTDNSVATNCLKHQAHICTEGTDVSFITTLPTRQVTPQTTSTTSTTAAHSTHLLLRSVAYPISDKPIYISTQDDIRLTTEAVQQAQFVLKPTSNQLILTVLNGSTVMLNGKEGQSGEPLNSGDRLSFNNTTQSLTLINVLQDESW